MRGPDHHNPEEATAPSAEPADPRRIALDAIGDLTVEEFGQVLARIIGEDTSLALITELVSATTTALAGIRPVAHQAFNGHTHQVVRDLGELLARAHAAVVVMTAEALGRGDIASSQKPTTTAWVRDHCRYLHTTGAAPTGKAAALLRRPELQRLADKVVSSELPPAVAVAIAGEYDTLVGSLSQPYLDLLDAPATPDSHTTTGPDITGTLRTVDTGIDGAGPDPAGSDGAGSDGSDSDGSGSDGTGSDTAGAASGAGPDGTAGWTVRDVVLEQFCAAGNQAGTRGVKNVRDHLLAQYGTAQAFADEHDTKRKYLDLSNGQLINGIWRYELTLDPESRAEMEAAINQLAKPSPPHPETGEIDLRSAGQRRGQALVEVCRRAATAAHDVPTNPKSILHITIGLDDLIGRTGYGTAIGSLADGTLLPVDTIRKLACNAGIIPTVLGSTGAPLDLGRTVRCFTTTQARALWLRDRHCTFPGCDVPATWCENHHLIHAADGGPTDLCNGALLCGRHHDIVHRDQLAGRLIDGRVVWDLRCNSYPEALQEHRGREHRGREHRGRERRDPEHRRPERCHAANPGHPGRTTPVDPGHPGRTTPVDPAHPGRIAPVDPAHPGGTTPGDPGRTTPVDPAHPGRIAPVDTVRQHALIPEWDCADPDPGEPAAVHTIRAARLATPAPRSGPTDNAHRNTAPRSPGRDNDRRPDPKPPARRPPRPDETHVSRT